jgi:hypothetical protein
MWKPLRLGPHTNFLGSARPSEDAVVFGGAPDAGTESPPVMLPELTGAK